MKLLFVGDVMLGRLVNDYLQHTESEYPWGDTLPLFKRADLRICNLECAVTDDGVPWSQTPKMFHFRTDAKNVGVLNVAQIDIVSLANNHALDFSHIGLFDTLSILSSAGIAFAGAGLNIKEAMTPLRLKKNGVQFGFITFTDNEPAWEATREEAGIYFVPTDRYDPRTRELLANVTQLKQEVDTLIVSAHWGGNWGYDVPAEHREVAHALIDAGADIVFGHSPHIFRAVEVYKQRPIMYSCGDFIDDYAVDSIERNDESFMFELELVNKLPKQLTLYPTIIEDFHARRASDRAKIICARMNALSEELGTTVNFSNDGTVLHLPCINEG